VRDGDEVLHQAVVGEPGILMVEHVPGPDDGGYLAVCRDADSLPQQVPQVRPVRRSAAGRRLSPGVDVVDNQD
jgi:hypothetical protein